MVNLHQYLLPPHISRYPLGDIRSVVAAVAGDLVVKVVRAQVGNIVTTGNIEPWIKSASTLEPLKAPYSLSSLLLQSLFLKKSHP